MKLRVLGCSGGIGSDSDTTSLLVDSDVLIDAGTGIGNLKLDELVRIDHIFVTHSHLDHIAFIPFLVDTVGFLRKKPVIVYATQETVNILQNHMFNWLVWPDFTKIPNMETPYMQYEIIAEGEVINLDGRMITPLPANHVVPAVGFQVNSGRSSLVFTGDTTTNDALWSVVNTIENLKYLIIEAAFCEAKRDIAIRSKHLCPSLLCAELDKLKFHADIYVTHLKQGEDELTMREIQACAGRYNPRRLLKNQIFDF
ncbi:3',5'-cyclic-nucleotide phosphodiesterase [Nitrosomonas marina]|uniref:Beta-lactamase superfamily domain-containing protein n=1 Tax=Nitrosomonas marina TaxID=917 RepID=A0A1H8E4Y1_9PROT|nr:3',5'-cyclic-nucleotide phosphodiesterase [Nitrosomonas marina]SEN14629.1 Beta-lactamase superfamily domain-containing protein [Nitrosomonas marina]